jgi:hypothetical protein
MRVSIIVVNMNSIERGRSGAITGRVHLRLGGEAFPESEWNDFVVILLGAWLRAVVALVAQGRRQESMMFMDGPYFVRVTAGPPARFSWRACARRKHGTITLASGELDASELLRDLTDAARAVADECRRREWSNRDVDELDAALREAAAAG